MFKPDSRVEPHTILVYRTARLGDFIVAVPALAALRLRFPQARIVLMTASSTMAKMQSTTTTYTGNVSSLPWLALVVPGLVDQAVVLSMQNWRTGLEQARQCVLDLNPDIAFILPFSGEDGVNRAKKMLFLWLAGVRSPLYGCRVYSTTRLLREAQYRAGMFEHQVWGPLHAVMECLLVPTVEKKDVSFPLTVDDEACRWSQQLWECHGWSGKKVVAVFPGGTFPHKRWPVEKFAEVCRTLEYQKDIVFVVIGAKTDQVFCDNLCQALGMDGCFNLCGQTSMVQLAALFKKCTLFIGNDSGPAHLASAMGCPSVTLFSSIEFQGFWEPWNNRETAVRLHVPCEHCFSYADCPLGTMACIQGIQTNEVLDLCSALLK